MVYIRKDGTANRTNETLCFAFERMPTLVASPYNHGQYSRDHWRNCLKYGEEFIETTGPSKMVNKPLMWEWKDSALYIGYDNAVVIWMLQRLLGNHKKNNKSQHTKGSFIENKQLQSWETKWNEILFVTANNGCWKSILQRLSTRWTRESTD